MKWFPRIEPNDDWEARVAKIGLRCVPLLFVLLAVVFAVKFL